MREAKKVVNTERLAQQQPEMRSWVMGGAPEKIYEQEAQGQKSLVNSDVLPTEMGRHSDYNAKAILEAAGVKFLGVVAGDEIFQHVDLPVGWKKVATDHSMWSDLVDDNGRKRAAIFYKAAFYDRSAHMNLIRRFDVGEARDEEGVKAKKVVVMIVIDCDKIVFSTEPVDRPEDWDDENNILQQSRQVAVDWLNANYPDWQNPGAYWD